MSTIAVPQRPARDALAGWPLLVGVVAARAYLSFLAALAIIAVAPVLFGMSASLIEGGSMEPNVSIGDVVIASPFDPDADVPMGRVVTFQAAEGSAHSGLVMHRIVGSTEDGSLVTAGDANEQVDSVLLERDAIVAQAFLLVPMIGLPAHWLQTGQLLPFLGFAGATALAIAAEVASARRPRGARHASALVAAALSVGLLCSASVAAGGPVPVNAAFTAQSSSLGNSWSYAAAKPAVRLAFSTQPSTTATGGTAFSRQPVVRLLDAAGALSKTTKQVSLALTSANGSTLACASNPVVTAAGLATFGGCSISKTGTYTLTATASGLTSAVSTSIVVTVGPAAALRFVTTPGQSAATAPFAVQPSVEIVDAGGNRTSSTAAVTLALAAPNGATLACAVNPRAATSGLATFASCRVSTAGAYSLLATTGALAPATSAVFNVTPVPALSCSSSVWMATFAWSPTPHAATTYRLYVNGSQIAATGADGWNSYVQITSANLPASKLASGSATVLVTKVLAGGVEQSIGTGTVTVGPAWFRTYACG